MENQHRKISGYRELNQVEIDLINDIKQHGLALEQLCERLNANILEDLELHDSGDAEPRRWLAIGKTHLQQGLMALTRSIARPGFF